MKQIFEQFNKTLSEHNAIGYIYCDSDDVSIDSAVSAKDSGDLFMKFLKTAIEESIDENIEFISGVKIGYEIQLIATCTNPECDTKCKRRFTVSLTSLY